MPHAKRTATGVLGGLLGLVGLSAIAGILITATVTPAIAVSSYAAGSTLQSFEDMPSFLRIDRLMLPNEYYRKDSAGNDVLMAQFYDQNRIPVTLDEVAPVMLDAMVASEDKDFFSHGGVNLVGTVSALLDGDRGGSSITQQYVKNVLQQSCVLSATGDGEEYQQQIDECYASTTVNKGSEGYKRKLQEMRYAIRLEKDYSKDEILMGYLNIASFGGTTYGVGAAAQRYFGVSAADLTIAQAATIAGMVQAPNAYRIDQPENEVNGAADGYAETLDRRNYVLERMLADGRITQAEYDEAYATPIEPHVTDRPTGCALAVGAEFFCQYVKSLFENDPALGETDDERRAALRLGGYKVYTTLDPDLQNAAQAAVSLVPGHVDYMNLGATGVQVEVGTGRVLSMVQNRPFAPSSDDTSGNDNGTTTPINYNVREADGGSIGRHAGSTFKLFSIVNWLEHGFSINEVLNGRWGTKKIDLCDGQTVNVMAGNVEGGVGNFDRQAGYNGTIVDFTRDSLNSGFLAMAERISVCTTNQAGGKLGVTRGDGTPLDQVPPDSGISPNQPFNVLGDANVAPLDMAGAYATIASNGILCTPKAIDRIVDRDGQELAAPGGVCDRVLSPEVASTTAYALASVMRGSGSGATSANRVDAWAPMIGKTGTHELSDTWMDGTTTKVATVVWVGNVNSIQVGTDWQGNAIWDTVDLEDRWENDEELLYARHRIWPQMQSAANAKYGGDEFPDPDSNLTRRILIDLPSVIGKTVDEATKILQDAGFGVTVGEPMDAAEAAGTVVSQDPAAGRVGGGVSVTIRPSSGKGATVPGVSGTPQDAAAQLRSAGFSNVKTQCTQRDDAPEAGVVTGTSPAAGSVVSKSDAVTIAYQARSCR